MSQVLSPPNCPPGTPADENAARLDKLKYIQITADKRVVQRLHTNLAARALRDVGAGKEFNLLEPQSAGIPYKAKIKATPEKPTQAETITQPLLAVTPTAPTTAPTAPVYLTPPRPAEAEQVPLFFEERFVDPREPDITRTPVPKAPASPSAPSA